MSESGAVEGVEIGNLLKFGRDRLELACEVSRIIGVESAWRNIKECARRVRWLCCWERVLGEFVTK